jgi:hypothetical protein
MKRAGFSKEFAAATEAVAGTGGQIMPPVMAPGRSDRAVSRHLREGYRRIRRYQPRDRTGNGREDQESQTQLNAISPSLFQNYQKQVKLYNILLDICVSCHQLKIRSVSLPARITFALFGPNTNKIASAILLLPEPFGPVIAVKPGKKWYN